MSQMRLLNDLVEEGLISEGEKEEIIKDQWESGDSIERILVERGYLTEEKLLQFISRKYKLPLVSLSNIEIDIEATYHVPAYLAEKLNLIPVRRIDRNLIIAISEPFNEAIVGELRKVTDLKFVPLLASKSEIEEMIDQIYNHEEEIAKPIPKPSFDDFKGKEITGSFDEFIAGRNNSKAYKLALAFSRSEIDSLLIVGDTGTGKTYLLGAIHRSVQKNGKNSLFISIPDFQNLYVKFKNNGLLPDLRDHILSHDVFLIDEIEVIQNKPFLQEELEYLIRKFKEKNGQIAVASMITVANLKGVSRKLISLLSSMIEVGLGKLDRDTITKYLQSGKFELSELDIETILKENPRNFHELEGIVKKVLAIKKFLSSNL